MEIKNAKYVKDSLTNENSAVNCQIGNRFCCVPMNEVNTDYQNILKWVADGNTIEAAD
tara:strand:- start:42 stop:215 length:174 start_codon:yes stop_codon:yes gene_type:complete